jgi:hypothetical protein
VGTIIDFKAFARVRILGKLTFYHPIVSEQCQNPCHQTPLCLTRSMARCACALLYEPFVHRPYRQLKTIRNSGLVENV